MYQLTLLWAILLCLRIQTLAQSTDDNYWDVTDRNSILWDLTTEDRLPHHGNIEMAGAQVAAIVYYDLDTNRERLLFSSQC